MVIYLFTQEWFDIQVLVVHVVLRSGIYLFTHDWFDIQVLVVHVVLRSEYLFIYTCMVSYTTSVSGTCCFKEWVFIYLFTQDWFDIQQALVVHVVLRSGD